MINTSDTIFCNVTTEMVQNRSLMPFYVAVPIISMGQTGKDSIQLKKKISWINLTILNTSFVQMSLNIRSNMEFSLMMV